jgi:hypothetical protein
VCVLSHDSVLWRCTLSALYYSCNVVCCAMLHSEDEADLLLAQGLPRPPHSSTVSGSTIADTGRHSAEEATTLLRAAEGLCVKLVTQDAIRAKSWTRRVLGIRQKLNLVVE